MSDEKKDGCGCWGCLSALVVLTLIWALVFGVTVDGKHYGISCSTDRGVEFVRDVEVEEPK